MIAGAKDDHNKLKLSRVPPEVIDAIAKVRDFGCLKYGDAENWKSISPDRWHEALLRHVVAMWNDPWHIDEESGLPSLWHVATNAAFLCANFQFHCAPRDGGQAPQRGGCMNEFKKCPVCGQDAVFIGVHDDEGNFRGLLGCEYEENPWSGLFYALHHEGWRECILCTDGQYEIMGGVRFDTAEEADEVWNRGGGFGTANNR